MTKENEVTIEDLARMIQKGFSETATKSDVEKLEKKMDAGFTKVDARFENVEGRL